MSTDTYKTIPIENAYIPPMQKFIRKRDGNPVTFDPRRIYKAIKKAFLADKKLPPNTDIPLSDEEELSLSKLTERISSIALKKVDPSGIIDIEGVQDIVETELMNGGFYSIARCYILYREEHKKARLLQGQADSTSESMYMIKTHDGHSYPLDWEQVKREVRTSCATYEECDPESLIEEISHYLYNNMTEKELEVAKSMAARTRIERDPIYSKVAANLLLNNIYRQVLGTAANSPGFEAMYREGFMSYVEKAVDWDLLDPQLKEMDLKHLAGQLALERDYDFLYMGLQTIYDRYLLHVKDHRIETPQFFWMRVAMGLAINEPRDREQKAVEFYNMLSTFRFISSTPTLFNSGTQHPQLSSCYLSTVSDSLEHIFKVISDNAKLSKWAGGLGNDWTNVRSTGSHIKGTNGKSQGVVPFLKVVNDTAIAVNQGGKRKGAICSYLEVWHLEIEEFQELRKNTGDERRRTHDMNTANWIPDLFMKRVLGNSHWTLFSPNDVQDLHDLYGQDFEKRYEEYERMAEEGKISLFKRIQAVDLWRRMLSMLFETGHPWITFKDPSNLRSPQDHVGVVHSSNLCTEILLNTSNEETAVCNLGSINLVEHIVNGALDQAKLKETINTAIRMLDNVIDINFYPTPEARHSNIKHRPIGLGIMGFQDALYSLDISYASEEAVEFADASMELVSWHAILASSTLAKERGIYQTYKGSKWSKGMIPIDTIDLLERERGGNLKQDKTTRLDWQVIRDSIEHNGMRNSNVLAIAPTATIANISGVSQSIEPSYKHLFVKSNLSGEFTIINPYLVEDLKKRSLWDQEMLEDLKYFDGSVQEIERIPEDLKHKYIGAFDMDQNWLIECASRRQKWIDMGQSINLYAATPSGKQLNNIYLKAWEKGLKTTYYLRSLGATQIEKSTLDINKRGIQPRWMKNKSASSNIVIERTEKFKTCNVEEPECEVCQ